MPQSRSIIVAAPKVIPLVAACVVRRFVPDLRRRRCRGGGGGGGGNVLVHGRRRGWRQVVVHPDLFQRVVLHDSGVVRVEFPRVVESDQTQYDGQGQEEDVRQVSP